MFDTFSEKKFLLKQLVKRDLTSKYKDSVLITDEVVEDIKANTKYAPLHHPGNLAGIDAMRKALPNVPNG